MALKRGRQLERETFTVQERSGREPGGGQSDQWRDVRSIQGRLVPATAADVQRLGQTDTTVTHQIVCPEDPGMHASQRLKLGARVFMYRGAFNAHEADRFWVVAVEEVGIVSRNPGTNVPGT